MVIAPLLFLLSAASWSAEPGYNAAIVQPAAGFQKSRIAPSERARRPRIGRMTGGFGGAPADLHFDRDAWTIKGGLNASPVDVRIDHQGKRITGGANHSPVDLRFQWTPEALLVEGGANRSSVRIAVDWKRGVAEGYANGQTLKIAFNLSEGRLKGEANGWPVELNYDSKTGRLTGGFNGAPVDALLENMDLSDLIAQLWLLMRVPVGNASFSLGQGQPPKRTPSDAERVERFIEEVVIPGVILYKALSD